MFVTTVKFYQDANVDTIPDENEKFFWIRYRKYATNG